MKGDVYPAPDEESSHEHEDQDREDEGQDLAHGGGVNAAPAVEPAPAEEPQRPTRTSARDVGARARDDASPESIAVGGQRGRFASMTIEELHAKYPEVVGRSTGSDDRRYLTWKIREGEKGRINVGPRKTRARDGEPLEVKILLLRLSSADVADKMDEGLAQVKGIKNRMESGGHRSLLAHLGARDAAARLTNAGSSGRA
ncbi:MAG: hypothetical protein IPG50_39855 [Myxococcales bacterium]|nr:hypothetical protein [Myxococcales bacterium]